MTQVPPSSSSVDLLTEEDNIDQTPNSVEDVDSPTSTGNQTTAIASLGSTPSSDALPDGKINLFLKATSDVPIMKKKRWQVDESKTIQWVITFIKRYLKLEDKETIFLYVGQAFAPAPDQQIKNLYECFGADGKLILHYSKTPAWG